MTNLPVKGSEERVVGDMVQGAIRIKNTNGYIITEINVKNSETIDVNVAKDIARLITEARDAGFEQGRKYVRDALGI